MERTAFDIAVLLLTVGMATVFAILAVIALASRALIAWTNRMATPPEAELLEPKRESGWTDDQAEEEMAVLLAAVHLATGGRGYPEQIRPLGSDIKN